MHRFELERRTSAARWLCILLAGGSLAGCAARQNPAPAPVEAKPAASGEQVTTFDINYDKKPDVWSYAIEVPGADGLPTRRVTRKEFDLNYDGRVDLVRVYDAKGQLAQTIFDLDLDGTPNVVTFFEQGLVSRKERDLDGDGKPDQFLYYEQGKKARSERDSNGDGKIDRWEYFENEQLARIGEDSDGDGKVDRWVQVTGARRPSRRPLVRRGDERVELGLAAEVREVAARGVLAREPAHAHAVPGALPRHLGLDDVRRVALPAQPGDELVRLGLGLGRRELERERARRDHLRAWSRCARSPSGDPTPSARCGR